MSGGGGKGDDSAVVMIVVILVLAAIGWVIWHFFHTQIIDSIRLVRIAELHIVKLFAHDVVMPGGTRTTPQELIVWLQGSNGQNLSWGQIAAISATVVPQFFHWPAVGLLALFGVLSYKFSSGHQLTSIYTLEDLIVAQSKSWPIITPIVRFNPATAVQRALGQPVPDTLPMFAEALSPEEWLAFNQIAVQDKQIDRDAAARAFVKQLGVRWQGADKLPLHLQALYAAFALKGARKRDDADQLLSEIADCWTPKRGLKLTSPLKSKIRRILRDPKTGGELAKIASKHAFVVTAMIDCVIWCRAQGGVLAPAAFLWLRAQDRPLWYALNNSGRRTFHAEAAGATAHFYAERMLKRALPMPKVESAVNALQDYMDESEMELPSLHRSGKPAAGGQRKLN